VQEDKTVKVEDVPVPTPKDEEILLRVLAVGQNPTDWKHVERISKPGMISGCDFVGEVVELGSTVPPNRVRKGEVRWGFMRGGFVEGKGAFAEYVTVAWDVSSIVASNLTPQQAASIPIPFVTAIQALYLRLKIPEPPQSPNNKWILVWSGATAVGQYAIQLAKLSGLKVATTASEKRWPLLKSLGADFVVDYKDPDVVKKLKEGTNDSIEYGLDCIAEKGSYQLAQQAFSPNGGHLIALLFKLENLPRTDVKTEATLAYTANGEDHAFSDSGTFKTSAEDRALYAKWCVKSTEMFEKGELKPLEIEVLGGLGDVQKGFDLMKSGKHQTKIVYTVG